MKVGLAARGEDKEMRRRVHGAEADAPFDAAVWGNIPIGKQVEMSCLMLMPAHCTKFASAQRGRGLLTYYVLTRWLGTVLGSSNAPRPTAHNSLLASLFLSLVYLRVKTLDFSFQILQPNRSELLDSTNKLASFCTAMIQETLFFLALLNRTHRVSQILSSSRCRCHHRQYLAPYLFSLRFGAIFPISRAPPRQLLCHAGKRASSLFPSNTFFSRDNLALSSLDVFPPCGQSSFPN